MIRTIILSSKEREEDRGHPSITSHHPQRQRQINYIPAATCLVPGRKEKSAADEVSEGTLAYQQTHKYEDRR